jgi:hypothetical protein
MPYTREIDSRDFTTIPRLRESMTGLPKDVAVCSVHGEEVVISLSDWLPNPSSGAPFAKAAWIGCCSAHVDKIVAIAWEVSSKNVT